MSKFMSYSEALAEAVARFINQNQARLTFGSRYKHSFNSI